MLRSPRGLGAAALLLTSLGALAPSGSFAQETASNTAAPSTPKGFDLPGRRTTPPAAPVPAPTPPSDPVARPAPSTTERRPEPRPAERAETRPAERAPAAPVAEPALEAPPSVSLPEPAPQSETALPPVAEPAPPASSPAAETQPAGDEGSSWLVYAAGGVALLVLLAWAAMRLRRRAEEKRLEQARGAARAELGDALFAKWRPEAQPVPTPEPEATPVAFPAEAPPRAWLEIDINAERAAATDSEATVHYALTLANRGEAAAGNIRIDARLFNASAEGEMLAFFQGPIHEQSGSPHVTIAPDGRLTLMGQVTMPMADVREIELQGRRIFVPMVAINVAYDWEGGSGRTSRSWLVGREPETPSAKMGAFRLDLGPRVYRQVGQREAKAVMV